MEIVYLCHLPEPRFGIAIASAGLWVMLLSACEQQPTAAPAAAVTRGGPPAAAPQSADSVSDSDTWVGRWTGPEGTFLEVAGKSPRYVLTIRNLDGPRTFPGEGTGSRIAFERDGVRESIRRGNGDDTGMKWLAGKSDCLVVKSGEGYCRT